MTGRSHRPTRHPVLTLLFVAAKAACGVRSGYQLCEQNQGTSNERSDPNANTLLLGLHQNCLFTNRFAFVADTLCH